MKEILDCLGLSLQEAVTLVVAICALFFSGWQLFTQKRHNKLSVKPFLTLRPEWEGDRRYVNLKNVGLGPAVIVKHVLTYKGKVVATEIGQDFFNIAEDHLGPGYYSGGIPIERNQVLEVGEEINYLGLYWHEQHDAHEARGNVINFLENAELEVVYESMYGEKHKMKSGLASPDDYHYH